MGRDWVLAAAVVVVAAVEALLRPEVAWRPVSFLLAAAIATLLPWRRVHPLLVVATTFAMVGVIDVVSIVMGVDWEGLGSAAVLLVMPYSLARWGSGRAIAAGFGFLAVPIILTAVSGSPAGDLIGGSVVLVLPVTIGAVPRYQQASRAQELDSIRSRERAELARELHDTIAHHVSAIAVRAQAGRAVAATRPDAATDALAIIEEEASRALEEMRSMVGALRDGDAELVPQQGAIDVERLADASGPGPKITVSLTGALAGLRPSVDAACYRLAQEAVTNALRHAHRATLVKVSVTGTDDDIRVVVDDDGRGGVPGPLGFGLVGMSERAKLLGGTCTAGPRPDGGWRVCASLPRHGERR